MKRHGRSPAAVPALILVAVLGLLVSCSSDISDSNDRERDDDSKGQATVPKSEDPDSEGATKGERRDQLAPTPPMGWNSWNQVRCNGLSEDVVKAAADAIVRDGLDKVGYEYVVVDDCWQSPERDAKGALVPNPKTFPSGMKALADYVHEKGLKFGMYLVPGSKTCAMIWDAYPGTNLGSVGHERQDAEMLEDIGVDYLKYDWCSADESDGLDKQAAFTLMRDELDRLGRPIVYSISEYGEGEPWKWASGIANLWRTTGDIAPMWLSIVSIIDSQADLHLYSSPGRWNDPDMLQVGNGDMTPDEIRSHFGMWAMLAAPLFLGTDLDNLDPTTLKEISNPEIIAIDQDPLGKQARRVRVGEGEMWLRQEVWVRELEGGDIAVALFNKADTPAEMTSSLQEVGASPGNWNVRDATNRADMAPTDSALTATGPAHGLVILRLSQRD